MRQTNYLETEQPTQFTVDTLLHFLHTITALKLLDLYDYDTLGWHVYKNPYPLMKFWWLKYNKPAEIR